MGQATYSKDNIRWSYLQWTVSHTEFIL